MNAGALVLSWISEFEWWESLCIHVRNTSPVVIIWQLHYVRLVNLQAWISWPYVYRTAGVLIFPLHLIFGRKTSGLDNMSTVISTYCDRLLSTTAQRQMNSLCSLQVTLKAGCGTESAINKNSALYSAYLIHTESQTYLSKNNLCWLSSDCLNIFCISSSNGVESALVSKP